MLEKGPNGFNRKLRSALQKHGFFVSQIESETGRGIPDLHASCTRTGALWVECKVSKPKTKITVNMRPDQIVWHEKNYAANGAPSWVAVAAFNDTKFILYRGKFVRDVAVGKTSPPYTFTTIEAMASFLAQEPA